MKRIFVYIAILLAGATTWSCMDETAITFDGMQVEWEGAINGSSQAYLRVNDGQSIIDSLRVNLIGAQQSSDMTVNFQIDTDATTAVEGLHYRPISQGTITIPANSSFGYYIFEVLDDNINPGEVLVLAIEMTGGDIEVATNHAVVEHQMQVSCPSALAGVVNYSYEALFNGFTGVDAPLPPDGSIEITDNGDVGVYLINDASFNGLTALYGAAPVAIDMFDVCNVVSFSGVDQYGDSYKWVINSNDGTTMNVRWENTYGDYGVVNVTRADGGSWPLDLEGADF